MSTLKRLFGRLAGSPADDSTAVETHAPPAAAATEDGARAEVIRELSAQIAAQSENKLAAESLDPNAEMCDAGYLDSLTYVGFLVFVEEKYGTRILDHQLTGNLRTIAAVADHVLAEKKSS